MIQTDETADKPTAPAFDPIEYAVVLEGTDRRGKPRTTVMLGAHYPLAWARTEHPDVHVETELLTAPGESPAVVRSTVTLGDGRVQSAYGQCSVQEFAAFLEKAETRSWSRALSMLGYSERAPGFEAEAIRRHRETSNAEPRRRRPAASPQRREASRDEDLNAPAPDNYRRRLMEHFERSMLDDLTLFELVNEMFGKKSAINKQGWPTTPSDIFATLTIGQARRLADELKKQRTPDAAPMEGGDDDSDSGSDD